MRARHEEAPSPPNKEACVWNLSHLVLVCLWPRKGGVELFFHAHVFGAPGVLPFISQRPSTPIFYRRAG